MHLVVVQVYIDYICNLLLNENKNWQNIPLLPLYWGSKIHVHFVVSRQMKQEVVQQWKPLATKKPYIFF